MITREVDALSEWHGSEGFELLPEAREARDWLRAERELVELSFYADDRDGHGSPAPGAESLRSAVELLAIVRSAGAPAPSRVLPTEGSGVLVEWDVQDEYLEAEIEEPGRAEWMRRRSDGSYEHWQNRWDPFLPRHQPELTRIQGSAVTTVQVRMI